MTINIPLLLMNKKHLCKSHYISVCQVVSNQSCQLCSSTTSSQWHSGRKYLDKLGSQTCEHSIDPSAWLCDECFKIRIVRQGKYQTICDEVLEYSLKLLKDKGACMVKDATNLFKDKILDQCGCSVSDNDWESYQKTLGTKLETRGYKSYFLASAVVCTMTLEYFQERELLLYNLMNENKSIPPTNTEYT